MAASEEISHKGRVKDVSPEFITVEIISESACASCHARALCAISESETREIQIPSSPWKMYAPGDEVTVSLKASMGHKAVWIAYALPLLVLLCVIGVLTFLGVQELYTGLSGIGAVLVYYFIVWLFRGRLRNEYIFEIK